jgi:UDP-N-acetylmuramate dehydrogenase
MSELPGVTWRTDEPLRRHTALRTGGACPHFVVVHTLDALPTAMERLEAHPGTTLVLGAGTRGGFRDGSYDRAILRLGVGFTAMRRDGDIVEVGAATPCPAVAWAAAARGFEGFEALARVPGSLGAALLLDEGAWRDGVREVLLWSRGGARWRTPDKARGAKLILAARLSLAPADPARVQALTRAALAGARALPAWYKPLRRGTPGDELTRVGATGVRVRGASIPVEAPEMLVNGGGGSAADLVLLHRTAVERVARMRGVDLEPSFSFLGRS